MINYDFFQFIKKRIGPDWTVPVPSRGGLASRDQRWDRFDFSEFGPLMTVSYEPYWIVVRPNLNRIVSDRTVCKSIERTGEATEGEVKSKIEGLKSWWALRGFVAFAEEREDDGTKEGIGA
jgi:hypothetical protein